MAEVTRKRRGEIVRGVFEVLADEPEGLQVQDVIERVRELVPPTPYEAAEWPNLPGQQRYPRYVQFHTIPAARAGWLVKDNGIWRLTEKGRTALAQLVDPETLQKTAEQKYREWRSQQAEPTPLNQRWQLVLRALEAMPDGTWTSYKDLAELTSKRWA
ncbi:MAG TPA: winged helix-turn-helix domain-containing protein [Actinomycetota bacterium]|nr:winged helix-turn-helix domain-containing protein [Actinomycetota bacterium]